ncbi:unnamed protein product [Chrysoparadoxa australica]
MKRSESSHSIASNGSDSFNLNLLASGELDTLDYRLQHIMVEHEHPERVVSAWHDIPLYELDADTQRPTGVLNFVCEIPRCSRKKYEIATKEPGNPIKQDEKKGKLREAVQLEPTIYPPPSTQGDIFFNYGCLPRTWEDPDHVHPETGFVGDNDPLDVCEIGLRIIPTGEVRSVKVLGVLAMIDDDETDWKIIAIDKEDRWASELNDVTDLERLLPGVVDCVREWFRTYKIGDGKPPNKFALDEVCMPRKFAMKVVSECHLSWRKLVGKAESGEEIPRNLSVSKLSDLLSDVEPDHVLDADFEANEGEEDYPASLIA